MKEIIRKNFTPAIIISIIYTLLFAVLLYPSLYKLFKPFEKQIFGSKEALWTAFGIIPAIATFFISNNIKERDNKRILKNAIGLFQSEIINNIDILFTGEVERPAYFEAFENIKRNYYFSIQNLEEFEKIRKLYDDLRYYQEILKSYWHLERKNGGIVTEKQFLTCNSFYKYFHNKDFIDFRKDNEPPYQILREIIIKYKEENMIEWRKILEKNINKIFKI